MAWIYSRHGNWIYCRLMGLRYRNQETRTKFSQQHRDTPLSLVREPANTADPNAIRVLLYTADGDIHVGFVPKEVAAELAPRMDANERFICTIVDSRLEKPCIRIKPHALQNLPEDHVWNDELPNHYGDQ